MSEAGASVPRMDRRADRGAAGEDLAAAWYTDRGFHVVERNWRCPAGELDLVGSAVRPAAVRFDVASVSLTSGGASIEVFEDAF